MIQFTISKLNTKWIVLVIIITIISIFLASIWIFDDASDLTQVELSVEIPDSENIKQMLKNDMIGYGFLWEITGNEKSNGILTNIHIQNGKIVDSWHSELVNIDKSKENQFCIHLQESIEDIEIKENKITTVIEFEDNYNKSNFSNNYSIIKLVNDSNCYYNIKAIVISNDS